MTSAWIHRLFPPRFPDGQTLRLHGSFSAGSSETWLLSRQRPALWPPVDSSPWTAFRGCMSQRSAGCPAGLPRRGRGTLRRWGTAGAVSLDLSHDEVFVDSLGEDVKIRNV